MNKQPVVATDPLYDFFMRYDFALKNQQWDEHIFENFKQELLKFYACKKRYFRWRLEINQYYVVVSEIMLQQTQTQRVEQKFDQWIEQFPDFESLAAASLAQVISLWVGLGYNRRAKALYQIAQRIVIDYNGQLPNSVDTLKTFYGLGPATAASIVVFAFNSPVAFIETNIRAVFLHVFFNGQESIPDSFLMPLIEATLDKNDSRQWYYALMDYGVIIKKLYKNPARGSKHYAKQSKFEGSDRQIRGWIVATTSKKISISFIDIKNKFSWATTELIEKIVTGLIFEGLICRKNELIFSI